MPEKVRVFRVETLICAECGEHMFGAQDERKNPAQVFCPNKECSQYLRVAQLPVLELDALPVTEKV